jgi:hypothetical protein
MSVSVIVVLSVLLVSSAAGGYMSSFRVKGDSQKIIRSVVEVLPTYTPTPTNTPTPTYTPTPTRTPTPTPLPLPTRIPASATDIDKWFEQYSREFNVDIAILRKIAVCESGYNSVSNNKKHNYGGMFQFSASTWTTTRLAMGVDPNPDLRFHPGEAIKTAAYKISRNGTGAWPACSK